MQVYMSSLVELDCRLKQELLVEGSYIELIRRLISVDELCSRSLCSGVTSMTFAYVHTAELCRSLASHTGNQVFILAATRTLIQPDSSSAETEPVEAVFTHINMSRHLVRH